MNESISAEELDLLNFFEVELKMRDVDIPWLYNDSLYEVIREDLNLSFAVAPSYKDVRIILKRGEHLLYELNATDVEDIRYHNDKGRETLEVRLNDRDRLWLQVKPAITIAHSWKVNLTRVRAKESRGKSSIERTSVRPLRALCGLSSAVGKHLYYSCEGEGGYQTSQRRWLVSREDQRKSPSIQTL